MFFPVWVDMFFCGFPHVSRPPTCGPAGFAPIGWDGEAAQLAAADAVAAAEEAGALALEQEVARLTASHEAVLEERACRMAEALKQASAKSAAARRAEATFF